MGLAGAAAIAAAGALPKLFLCRQLDDAVQPICRMLLGARPLRSLGRTLRAKDAAVRAHSMDLLDRGTGRSHTR